MKALAVLFAGSALALAANATVISGGSFSNPLQTTEISQTGTLAKFDSNLGHLTSLSLTLTGDLSTIITLKNNATQTQTAKSTTSVDLFFGSTEGALAILFANPVVSLTGTTGFQTLASGASVTLGPLTNNGSWVLTTSNAAALAALSALGGGTFGLDCHSISGVAVSGGGGNVASSQATQAACGASLSYTYDVPEPDALALVGLALAGIALVTRRKA
jgi:hypothetical protein